MVGQLDFPGSNWLGYGDEEEERQISNEEDYRMSTNSTSMLDLFRKKYVIEYHKETKYQKQLQIQLNVENGWGDNSAPLISTKCLVMHGKSY